MKNTLTLRKCAYIFDSTKGPFYYGTREQIEKMRRTNKELESYYYDAEKRAAKIPYFTDENNNIFIEILGEKHALNDLEILSIDGAPDNIINHRRIFSVAYIAKNAPHFHQWTKNSLYSNKFKTLEFEFFTGPDELGYIRTHFKGNCARFIIDNRTGNIYSSGEHGRHKLIDLKEITDYLDISSAAALNEFLEIMNLITVKNYLEV